MQCIRQGRNTTILSLLIVCLLAISYLNPFSVAHAQSTQITLKPTSGLQASTPFPAVSVNWPSLGFDAENTSFNPYEHQISPSNVSKLTLAWSFNTGQGLQQTPVEANGVVYTANGGIVYALNASTGSRLWSVNVGNAAEADFSPAVANGMVYAIGSKGSENDYVYAFNASTGAQVWRSSLISAVDNSPVVENGMLYIYSITYPGYIIALNASTGAKIWKLSGVADVVGITVANGNVYTHGGNSDGIIALNAKTGKKLWSNSGKSGFLDWAAAANGAVYAGDTNGNVYAWNARNGNALWSTSLGSRIFVNPPAVANGVVYFGFSNSSGGGTSAFDAQTGKQLWSYGPGGYATAIIVNGMVFMGSSKNKIDAFHLPA